MDNKHSIPVCEYFKQEVCASFSRYCNRLTNSCVMPALSRENQRDHFVRGVCPSVLLQVGYIMTYDISFLRKEACDDLISFHNYGEYMIHV